MFLHVYKVIVFVAEGDKRKIDSIGRQASLMCDRVNTIILFPGIYISLCMISIVNR